MPLRVIVLWEIGAASVLSALRRVGDKGNLSCRELTCVSTILSVSIPRIRYLKAFHLTVRCTATKNFTISKLRLAVSPYCASLRYASLGSCISRKFAFRPRSERESISPVTKLRNAGARAEAAPDHQEPNHPRYFCSDANSFRRARNEAFLRRRAQCSFAVIVERNESEIRIERTSTRCIGAEVGCLCAQTLNGPLAILVTHFELNCAHFAFD